jgi:ATP-binding cassette subfamily B protein
MNRGVWLVAGRLGMVSPGRYFGGGLLWVLLFLSPVLSGLVLKGIFDQLSGGRAVSLEATLWLCAALVGVELIHGAIFWVAIMIWSYWWIGAETTLRVNVLRSVLTAPGPAATRLPRSSGEAVSRFRDDVLDLTRLTDNLVDVTGAVVFSTTAFAIMAAIDPVITVALVVPLLVVMLLNRMLGAAIQRVHARARQLGATVTEFIGEMFAGVLALKTSGAEPAALARLREHNQRRRGAAVRDRLLVDTVDTVTAATIDVSVGLVLLLAAPAMRRGDFTIGDFALFTSYIGWLTILPRFLGRILYRVPQGIVATERLTRLMTPHENADHLSRRSQLWFGATEPPPAMPRRPERLDPLRVLEARGLTVRYPESDRGVLGVDIRVERGSFTVVTGAVGAGKTTLVRGLLGLLPLDGGTVTWNGQRVDDPGTFLVPDRVAYASQVPRLFSESLQENLLLGWPAGSADLQHAVGLATLDRDLAEMPDGLDTVVGSRGVRLSGGQVQRATAARALVRTPDLLVVDDLSSALDVETEQLLWEGLAEAAKDGRGPATLLVVSHRRAALERADRVVVLDRGRVVGAGPLDQLLQTCPEMRRLWSEELVVEAEEVSNL